MERRAELEHPLGLVLPPAEAPPPALDRASLPSGPADFVLELGTEELPPQDVVSASQQLRCARWSRISALRSDRRAVIDRRANHIDR